MPFASVDLSRRRRTDTAGAAELVQMVNGGRASMGGVPTRDHDLRRSTNAPAGRIAKARHTLQLRETTSR